MTIFSTSYDPNLRSLNSVIKEHTISLSAYYSGYYLSGYQHTIYPNLGPTQLPIQRVPGSLSLGVKRLERHVFMKWC